MRICSKPGCERQSAIRGLCKTHYKRAIGNKQIPVIQPHDLTLRERLNAYSKVSTESDCIEWTGCRNKDGYGQIQLNGRSVGAHRAAWEDANGPIPNGLQVLHHCDNPSCINPKHLFLGTQPDNVADMDAKKRRAPKKGEQNGRVKLTEDQVKKIREDRRFQKEIAAEYGVNQTLVSMIKRRAAWGHVS